jgi:rieske iron-sulfur protein
MKSRFSQERRDVLKTTCTLAAATALVSVGGSLPVLAAEQAKGVPLVGDTFVFTDGPKKGQDVMLADVVVDADPLTVQAKDSATGTVRDSDNSTILLYRVAADKIPADIADSTAEGVMAYSAVCTHLGCMLSQWTPKHEFMCPCHDATFDPLKGGANTGGATARTLPILPIKVADGKIVVAGKFSGYVGVKRT